LIDRDGRREPLDGLDLGLVHLPEEVSSIGRETLDVSALPFGVDRLERERGLARAREAGDDGKGLSRDRDVDILEVVFLRTAYFDGVLAHRLIAERDCLSCRDGSRFIVSESVAGRP